MKLLFQFDFPQRIYPKLKKFSLNKWRRHPKKSKINATYLRICVIRFAQFCYECFRFVFDNHIDFTICTLSFEVIFKRCIYFSSLTNRFLKLKKETYCHCWIRLYFCVYYCNFDTYCNLTFLFELCFFGRINFLKNFIYFFLNSNETMNVFFFLMF